MPMFTPAIMPAYTIVMKPTNSTNRTSRTVADLQVATAILLGQGLTEINVSTEPDYIVLLGTSESPLR